MESITVTESRRQGCAPIAGHEIGRSMESEEIAISFYEHALPPFIETEMERLYENVFSSLAKARIEGDGRNSSAYVVRKDGKVMTVFLFRNANGKVEVINEVMEIDEDDVRLFANAIFSRFQSATVILFHAVRTSVRSLPFPHQRFNCLEDIVLTLPNTREEYLAGLGKSTRQNIKHYMKIFERTFPTCRYRVYEKAAVSEQHIRDIIGLSSARMGIKNQVSLHDESKTAQLIRLVRMHGLIAVATIDDRVCGGVICSRSGANYFMHVIAHDPEYDRHSLGILCCYRAICECIDRGGREFHFLWGRLEYKYRLGGGQRELDNLAVYRSRAQFLLNGDTALKIAFRGYGRQVKRWLLDPKRADNFMARLAVNLESRVRNLRRFRKEHPAGRDGSDV